MTNSAYKYMYIYMENKTRSYSIYTILFYLGIEFHNSGMGKNNYSANPEIRKLYERHVNIK